MSKVSHLNFSLNTHFSVTNISSANPTSLCIIFIIVTPAMLFGTSNNRMCHMFLIISYIYIFLSEPYLSIVPFFFLHQFNHCLTGNAFYHIQHIITNAIYQWQETQQPNQLAPPMVRQCLHPAASLLPAATSPISRSLLAACRPMLVLTIAAQRLVSQPALINAPPTVQTK